MSKDLELLAPKIKQWRNHLSVYGKDCATIVNKDREEVPFVLNKAQEYMEERVQDQLQRKGYVRAIVLKGRQQGCSKWMCLRQLRNSTLLTNVSAFVMAHDASTTSSLFNDYKAIYKSLPEIPVIKQPFDKSNAKEMSFSSIGSMIKVGTAGSVEVGRGFTVNRFHGCLSADSLIVLSDGSTKGMGDIMVGDKVVTSSGAIAKVKDKVYTGKKQTYTLETWVSGEPIHLTADHKVLTDNGYKPVSDLTKSDYVVMPAGSAPTKSRVKSIVPRKIEDVWDIEVDHKDHNYQTTAGVVSNSETAFWGNGEKILAGVLQAIPLKEGNGTEVMLESTANGVGNFFFRMCMQAMKGEGEFELIFIPWWWTEEYQLSAEYEPSDEAWEYYDTWMRKDCPDEEEAVRKLAWRQAKMFELGEKKFKQEYPANATEAFQMSGSSLFKPEWIKCARDTVLKEDKNLPLIIGVDAAEAGGDRTSICFRRGNKITEFMVYDEMDEMRLAGICGNIIKTYSPARMFFDKAYAAGCVGRLKELGHGAIVKAIPFGSKPIEPDRFLNKRAEMHWMLKEWLEDGYVSYDAETGVGGVDIPDIDDFNADLACIPEPPPTSNGKIKMIGKDKIKEEFGMSPDMLDSAILTFAEPFMQSNPRDIKVKGKTATSKMFRSK